MSHFERAVGRRDGLLRMVADGPVMLAGLTVVVLLSGPLGRCAPAPPLVWLALAGVWLTSPGERIAVRVAYRYRQPSPVKAGQLQAALAVAVSPTKVGISTVDLCVRRGAADLNAYAAGRRSIAVSDGVAAALDRGQLSVSQVGALLAHEIGHLHARSSRYGLAVAWLAAPWRAVVMVLRGMLRGMLRGIVRKVPTARAGLVVLGPLVVVATMVQGVQQHAWLPLVAMLVVGVLVIVQPLLDAALYRAGERAADAYAAACGLGPDLAEALRSFDQSTGSNRRAVWASHPPRERRIRELAAAAVPSMRSVTVTTLRRRSS